MAACGGEGGPRGERPSPPLAAGDAGPLLVAALAAAARHGEAETLWALLSASSKRRAGPTLEEFSRRRAPALARTLAPFAGPGTRVVVSEQVARDLGLVALARGRRALALLLRLEPAGWRAELPGALALRVLVPRSGRPATVSRVAVAVRGGGAPGQALIYLDGTPLLTRATVVGNRTTVEARLLDPPSPGRHVAVALVSRGRRAAAAAWTFLAR